MTPAGPRVLAVLPGLIPSTLISVVKPLSALHHAGHIVFQVNLEAYATTEEIAAADVVILCRNTEPRFARLLHRLQRHNKPYIYDLDDNFFVIPDNSEEGRYHRDPARLRLLEQYLANASLVRLYSKPLRQRVLALNPRVEMVSGALDWSLIPAQAAEATAGPVRVVYVTSRQEDRLSRIFAAAVGGVLERRPGQMEMVCWGYLPDELRGKPNVKYRAPIPDYDRFLARLARGGFAIGLAPLLDDEFHLSKTNNKFREYGACRIAGIYSDVGVYADSVVDGQTGLLVPNEAAAWGSALERLVDDAALRSRIQAAARQEVYEHYRQQLAEDTWLRQIRSTLEKSLPTPIEAPGSAAPSPDNGAALEAEGVLRALGRMAAKLARRIRALGWRPAMISVYRYLYSLWLLGRIRRSLAASGARAVSSRPVADRASALSPSHHERDC